MVQRQVCACSCCCAAAATRPSRGCASSSGIHVCHNQYLQAMCAPPAQAQMCPACCKEKEIACFAGTCVDLALLRRQSFHCVFPLHGLKKKSQTSPPRGARVSAPISLTQYASSCYRYTNAAPALWAPHVAWSVARRAPHWAVVHTAGAGHAGMRVRKTSTSMRKSPINDQMGKIHEAGRLCSKPKWPVLSRREQ